MNILDENILLSQRVQLRSRLLPFDFCLLLFGFPMKSVTTYPLRLPHSLKAAVARIAKEKGTSINQFVVTAVAEKLAALETASFFTERRQRADLVAFRQCR
jgi:hypothetical protein